MNFLFLHFNLKLLPHFLDSIVFVDFFALARLML